MSNMKSKLSLFKNFVARETEQTNCEINKRNQSLNCTIVETIPDWDKWKNFDTKLYTFDQQYCFIREVTYSIEEQHGKYYFKEFLKAMDLWQKFPGSHPLSAKGLQPENLFFFDIETTGLYSGTGNIIFLLGYARFVDNKIVLKQHFLPEPGYEVALYNSFLESVDYTTLVTFNGKAFDWPQVKTQHTLVKEHVPKLPAFGHFDLYHASRRLWKDLLENVKLVTVEKEILGIERKDDVPGHLAPMIYFDYVKHKEPEGVFQILEHNEQDILSLITLFTHLSFQILTNENGQFSEVKMLIGKWFDSLGEQKLAEEKFILAAREGNIEAKYFLAFYLKRAGRFEEAKTLWMEVINDAPLSIQKSACVELAKLFEHQYKNIELAIQFVEKALDLHENKKDRKIMEHDPFIRECEKRLIRLLGKYNKSFPG